MSTVRKAGKASPRKCLLWRSLLEEGADVVSLGHPPPPPRGRKPCVELTHWFSAMTDPCPGGRLCARASRSRPRPAGRRGSLVTATGHSRARGQLVRGRGVAWRSCTLRARSPHCGPCPCSPRRLHPELQPRSGGIFIASFLIKQQ